MFISLTREQANAIISGQAKKAKKVDSFVVALGETTGHRHVLTMERPASLIVEEIVNQVNLTELGIETSTPLVLPEDAVVELEAPGTMTHEEHGKLTLPAGIYLKRVKKEFDPFTEQFRAVRD